MAGLTLKAPAFMQQALDRFQVPPDIDLNGGVVKNVETREEIDPEDGCKVQVTTVTIVSADGAEESRITKRRKLKVNCTQHTKRFEICNGKESKLEEKTEILTGDIDGIRQQEFENIPAPHRLPFDTNNVFAGHMLNQQEFNGLLNQKIDELQKSFPSLFSAMRKKPNVYETPSTLTETVVNPDGSTVTRTKSSKAYSSRFTKRETFVNGVMKESKCKIRAFMQYKGPDGGFIVSLANGTDDDLSEDENEDEDVIWTRFNLPDCKPTLPAIAPPPPKQQGIRALDDDRMSHSSFSEITDTSSALIIGSTLPKIQKQKLKTHEKAFHAVQEIVDSEGRYVSKLALLEKFRHEVEKENILDSKRMHGLFANISSLYQFHNAHLYPQLLDRAREWQTSRRISDVFKKQAPFMKMYSEYTNNYKQSIQIFEKSLKKKKKFADIVHVFEKNPDCENLPLISHMICPVQRVMRYQLLLKEYLKCLKPGELDFEDTEKSLDLVLEAASHANEMMRRLDRYRNVLEVQEMLVNSISLVSPGRELLKRCKVMKISSSNEKTEERHLFIFNDIILLASERSIVLGGKLRVRAIFDAYYTQICEGDNLERENSFYLRGNNFTNGPATRVELFTETPHEKKEIIDCIWQAISEAHQRKKVTSMASSNGSGQQKNEKKSCSKCDAEFSWFVSSTSCSKCKQRFCKKCFGPRKHEPKPHRFCNTCIRNGAVPSKESRVYEERQDLLNIPAKSNGAIKRGYLKFKGQSGKTFERYFVIRPNFCLYSYISEDAEKAVAMLPVPGCEVEPLHEKMSFSLRHLNRFYIFTMPSDDERAEWMAALVLSANTKLPQEDNAPES